MTKEKVDKKVVTESEAENNNGHTHIGGGVGR